MTYKEKLFENAGADKILGMNNLEADDCLALTAKHLYDMNTENIHVRVSASGEIEQDGKILSTGGVHEPEFFQQFFANINKALFLENQGQ